VEGVVSNDHSYSDQQAAKPNPKTRSIPEPEDALDTNGELRSKKSFSKKEDLTNLLRRKETQ